MLLTSGKLSFSSESLTEDKDADVFEAHEQNREANSKNKTKYLLNKFNLKKISAISLPNKHVSGQNNFLQGERLQILAHRPHRLHLCKSKSNDEKSNLERSLCDRK